MSIVPASRPKLTLGELGERAAAVGVDLTQHLPIVVGIRGYYLNSMGREGKNDLGIYDDAIFLIGNGYFKSFNGNCDPSRERKGAGKGAGKGMAHLKAGLYHAHQCGLHKGKYEALVQTGGPVTVLRDGNPPYEDHGYFGINIHKGGANATWSEGCQTIYPSEYDEFISDVHRLVKAVYGGNWRKAVVPYLLLEQPA